MRTVRDSNGARCKGVSGPTCPPLVQVLALSGELEDSGVAVAVRHKDAAALGVQRHVGGFAEVVTVTSWYEGLAQRQQDPVFAVTADLKHLGSTAGSASGSC